jgi:hypothetical protein
LFPGPSAVLAVVVKFYFCKLSMPEGPTIPHTASKKDVFLSGKINLLDFIVYFLKSVNHYNNVRLNWSRSF